MAQLKYFKHGLILVSIVFVLRMLLLPLGLDNSFTTTVFSITWSILLIISAYAGIIGWTAKGWKTLLLSIILWPVVYTVANLVAVSLSYYGGLPTIFIEAAHVGENPNIPQHLLAHLVSTPILMVYAAVPSLIVWGGCRVEKALVGDSGGQQAFIGLEPAMPGRDNCG